jgi:outer membrane protein assembly factor BamB
VTVIAATRAVVVTAAAGADGVTLRASDAADGTRRWRQRLPYPDDRRFPRFGGLVDGTLYLTDGGTDVVAVDASDGTVRWRVDLYDRVSRTVPDRFLTASGRSPDWFAPRPLATPDTVYVQTSYGLHGLAPADGRERWRLYLGDRHDDRDEDGSPLIDPGGLALVDGQVWASYGGPVPSVYAVELIDGTPTVDRVRAPVRLPGRPVVTGDGRASLTDQVTWSTDARDTLAVGVAGGTGVAWQFPGRVSTGAAAFSPLATDGDRVFVCEGHEAEATFVVFALRAPTGGLEWRYRESLADWDVSTAAPAAFRLAHPAVADDTLLVGYGIGPSPGAEPAGDEATERGTLVALSTAEGRVRWRTDLPVAPESVAVAGDRVFVSGRRPGVVALAAPD